jgi:transcriptional regulator with XRE-family HTH domain
MAFSERLAFLRKQRGFTQQVLADAVNLGVLQIRRYERGNSQPTPDVIRRLAITLRVTTDELMFEKDERQPDDE